MKTYSCLYRKALFTGAALFFLLLESRGQTSQGNWLVGGTGSFHSTKLIDDPIIEGYSTTSVALSPTIGYFLKNSFVVGLKPSFTYAKYYGSGDPSFTRTVSIGPFMRYYFLPATKEFNLFAQGDFQYGVEWGGNEAEKKSAGQTSYSFLGGPVIFLNSSIGVEFTAGYAAFRNVKFGKSNEKFQAGIGFQVHLKKE